MLNIDKSSGKKFGGCHKESNKSMKSDFFCTDNYATRSMIYEGSLIFA